MSEPESKKLEERLRGFVEEDDCGDPACPNCAFGRAIEETITALHEKDEEIAHLNHLRHEDAQILDAKDDEIARLKLALSGKTFYEKPCESCGGPTTLPKFEALP